MNSTDREALLLEAAKLFRKYERHHREKIDRGEHRYLSAVHETMEKVEVNADIASRIEAALSRPSPSGEDVKRLREALEDFCLSAECAAGVDDDAGQDEAYSAILSSAGSALAASYLNARDVLSLPHKNGEVDRG